MDHNLLKFTVNWHMSTILPLKIIGFSLIELLITVTIISILASLATYEYSNYKERITYHNSMSRLNQEQLIIYKFYSFNKRCPNSSDTPNPFINVELTPTNNYFGDKIINTECNLELQINNITQITLRANTDRSKSNVFNEGIGYSCEINPSFSDKQKKIINGYLTDCN